jgi:hypothetical protein
MVRLNKGKCVLISLILLVAACTSFGYKYYGLQLASYEDGLLLGPDDSDDLPIKVCEPDEQVVGKCVVMMREEFERLRSDLIDMRERLERCEK